MVKPTKKTLAMIVSQLLSRRRKQQFTARELAEMIVKTETEFVINKTRNTLKEDKELIFQLMAEIGCQYYKLRRMNVEKTETRPYKYYYKKTDQKYLKALSSLKLTAPVNPPKPGKKGKAVKPAKAAKPSK